MRKIPEGFKMLFIVFFLVFINIYISMFTNLDFQTKIFLEFVINLTTIAWYLR